MIFLEEKTGIIYMEDCWVLRLPKNRGRVAPSHIDFILAHLHYTYYNSILVSRVCGGISPQYDRISTLWRL